MPRNIEIKARVRDFHVTKRRLEELVDGPVEIISQEDIYFQSSHGRLKLRIISSERAQLIYYDRPDNPGPKRSEYQLSEIDAPAAMKRILESACGVRGVVRKVRHLYMIGLTRVHLDTVEELDRWFLELEVVLSPDQSDEEGMAIAKALMKKLDVLEHDLLEGSYLDMIESQT